MGTTTIELRSITADPAVNVRSDLDEDTITRYTENFDNLPPMIVYDTPEGRLLAAGFHRFQAATRLGRGEVTVELREGSRSDAMEEAVRENATHGLPLTRNELCEAVRRLKHLNPAKTNRDIARELNVQDEFVSRTLRAERVQVATQSGGLLNDSVYEEVAKAPEKLWGALVARAADNEWTVQETRAAVRALRSEKVAQDYKDDLLRGEAEPFALSPNGERLLLPETLARRARRSREQDANGALMTLLHASAVLEQRWHPAGLARIKPDRLKRVLEDLERAQEMLDDVHTDLEELSKLRLVS